MAKSWSIPPWTIAAGSKALWVERQKALNKALNDYRESSGK